MTISFIDPMTGQPRALPPDAVRAIYTEPTQAALFDSGTLTLDLFLSRNFSITLTVAVTTLAILNWPSSGAVNVTLEITQATPAAAFDWGSVKWAGGTAPDLSTDGSVHFITLTSRDGGTTVYGFHAGSEMA